MNESNKRGSQGQAAARETVYTRELDRLLEQRRNLVLRPAYTIGGGTEQVVHRTLDKLHERRIAYMENRFRSITGHALNEFATARMRGKAQRDFDRGR